MLERDPSVSSTSRLPHYLRIPDPEGELESGGRKCYSMKEIRVHGYGDNTEKRKCEFKKIPRNKRMHNAQCKGDSLVLSK